jgi:hypothetical protein
MGEKRNAFCKKNLKKDLDVDESRFRECGLD